MIVLLLLMGQHVKFFSPFSELVVAFQMKILDGKESWKLAVEMDRPSWIYNFNENGAIGTHR